MTRGPDPIDAQDESDLIEMHQHEGDNEPQADKPRFVDDIDVAVVCLKRYPVKRFMNPL